MIDLQEVSIKTINLSAHGEQEVYENLRVLYTTPQGSVPFDREFGINTEFLDEPLPIAKRKLIVEYIEKTRRFESRATVQEVTFTTNYDTGFLIPKVVIKIDLDIS